MVVAEYLPGDESINYTSPYAGGNFSTITDDDDDTLMFDKYTYTNLYELQTKLGGPHSGIARCMSFEYFDEFPSISKLNSLKSYLEDYNEIPDNELPKNVKFGISFNSWSFNCPKFLSTFQRYLQAQGIKFVRQKLTHISQALLNTSSKTIFNCTGIGAHKLEGVNDSRVYPTRGQVVVVKAPHIHENVMRWGKDYATYLIKRPQSNDQLILGGFMQKDNWTGDTYLDETKDILKRTSELYPRLLHGNPHGSRIEDLEILRVVAGLRPSRQGGVRIEKTAVETNELGHNQYTIIHNYGSSGYGYQLGLGMGRKAVLLALNRPSKL